MPKIPYIFIRGAQSLINIIVQCSLKIHIKGKENIPQTPKALIVANHSSYLDVPILGHTFFRQLPHISWIISKENYRLWYLKWLYLVFKVIVVNGTIAKVKKDLKANRWVVIFPEGDKRWCPPRKAKTLRPKKGAAAIALSTGVPIIPVRIKGAAKILPPRSFKYQPKHSITVIIGKPFSFEVKKEKEIKESLLEQKTQVIMNKIMALA